jgi:hypothetical protein
MREVATSGADGWKSRSKGISSWTVSIAAAGGERERSEQAAARRDVEDNNQDPAYKRAEPSSCFDLLS